MRSTISVGPRTRAGRNGGGGDGRVGLYADEGDKVLFVFEGGELTPNQLASITFTDGEAGEWSFIEVDRLPEVTIPRLARRIGQALEAHRSARTVYLQEGMVPG